MLNRIRKLLTTIWYRLTSSPYRLLQRSGLFDPGYYLDNNPDVAALGLDPLAHYLTKGFTELRQPGPLFDRVFYLHHCPNLNEKVENPLLHFLQKGRYQGLVPNFLVDPDYYALENPDFAATGLDPLTHFLLEDGNHCRPYSPTPYFNPLFYYHKYPEAAQHTTNTKAAYIHFFRYGLKENRQPSIYFDTDFYLDKAAGLRELGFNPLSHYFMFGFQELKSPSPLFDAAFYSKTYKNEAGTDLFGHYLRHQKTDNRQPCSWFDPFFYRQTYLGGQQDTVPLQHFLEFGLKNQLYPNKQILQLADKPVISVLVPVYNVEIAHLNNCIRSVVYQSYPHWQLCLADDCSTNHEIRPVLASWAASDPRIEVVLLSKNSGISAATNAAAHLADGSYLAFLDNDDELAPEALQNFAQAINSDPADLYYSDEDLIGADGRQFSIFRKPGFNRELLLCHNYVTHCVLTKKSLYERVGGCAEGVNGAQDFDLFLKLSEIAETIVHIPQVLYHWRASQTSTSINHAEKHYADEAGRQSVADALVRRDISGEALFTEWKFFYRAKRSIVHEVSVTLVVNWQRQDADLLNAWLKNLVATAGHEVSQMIILTTRQPPGRMVDTFAQTAGIDTICRIFAEDLGPAERLHTVLPESHGELIAFVDGDLNIAGGHWLSALIEYGQSPEVGIVGGQIEYPGEDADAVTPIADCNVTSPWYYQRFLTDCSVLMNGRGCPQEVLSVGGDLFLLRRELLITAAGFNASQFPLLFALPDLSFCLHQQGKKNIYTPYCRAIMSIEGITRRRQSPTSAVQEKVGFQSKWFALLAYGDPFYNPSIVSDNGRSADEFRSWLTGPLPSADY